MDLTLELPNVDVIRLAVGLGLGALLSTAIAVQYVIFGRTFSNRVNLAYTMPLIAITIVLIITVVKTSIALSLGLVGALSIVRFRTPIKEPEELAYLFVSIGVGLAIGADQLLAAIMTTVFFLIFATARSLHANRGFQHRNLFISVDVRNPQVGQESLIRSAADALSPHVQSADLRRVDVGDDLFHATFYIRCGNDEALVSAIEALKSSLPYGSTVTFIEQDTVAVS